MRKIDEVIIHCSATTEDDDGSIKTNGYHYVVRRDGQVDTGSTYRLKITPLFTSAILEA